MKWREISLGYISRLDIARAQLEKDPYLLLELTPSATIKEIKSAYRKKMSIYHPDGQDIFLKDFSQEMTKLLNVACDRILEGRR